MSLLLGEPAELVLEPRRRFTGGYHRDHAAWEQGVLSHNLFRRAAALCNLLCGGSIGRLKPLCVLPNLINRKECGQLLQHQIPTANGHCHGQSYRHTPNEEVGHNQAVAYAPHDVPTDPPKRDDYKEDYEDEAQEPCPSAEG